MDFRALGASVRVAAPAVMADAVGLAGCGAVVYGVALVNVPAAYVIGGVMAILAAWLVSRARGVTPDNRAAE